MKTSVVGVRKIQKWERLALTTYLDVGGVLTNGYGHTGDDVFEGQKISERTAEAWLREDLQEAETCINTTVKVPLEQHQFDALVSFVFNVGCGAFIRSTLLKQLNAGRYEEVPTQMARWNKDRVKGKLVVVSGLVNRRAAEVALWNNASYTDRSHIRPVPAEPKKVMESRTMQGAALTGAGVAGEEFSRTAQELALLGDVMDWVRIACVVLTLLGLGLVVYGRLRLMRQENV